VSERAALAVLAIIPRRLPQIGLGAIGADDSTVISTPGCASRWLQRQRGSWVSGGVNPNEVSAQRPRDQERSSEGYCDSAWRSLRGSGLDKEDFARNCWALKLVDQEAADAVAYLGTRSTRDIA
jgi:hypothetical protein